MIEMISMYDSKIVIKQASIFDIKKILKMYQSLSYNSKYFFHPPFLDLRNKQILNLLFRAGLRLSCIPVFRKIQMLALYKSVFLSIIAKDCSDDSIVGYSFIRFTKKIDKKYYEGELGIIVKDNYQNKGIGNRLMHEIINQAKKNKIKIIKLSVVCNNYRAIQLYKNFKFIKKEVKENGDCFEGKLLCEEIYELLL
jgi:ribosomal protein S18 acetylase RimI-like enzyme